MAPRDKDPEYSPASLPEDHRLVKLGPPQGSGNFTCTDTDGVERLVEMPGKVRRVSYAARGSFAFIKLFPESDARLAGEIVHVVQGTEIKAWRRAGEWPAAFDVETTPAEAPAPAADSDDDDEPLPENPNRRHIIVDESDSEEDSDDE
ncbi:S1-like domain-containing protein [Vanrija pseudolonga]|uniref:S1-like domain-containing protein n=1 Tax=Vanrija pseudolonga TaxID=143232 RepID=A0AAF1BK65_9TREE|nr:S1-like domain-containing protein [Vanrija pseudolonga]